MKFLAKRLLPFSLLNDREVSTRTLTILLFTGEQGELRQSDIPRLTTYSVAAVSRNCILLEKMGLVCRRRADDDYRVMVLTLTEKGQEVYEQLTAGL